MWSFATPLKKIYSMNTKKLLGTSAYFTLNKEVIKRVGIEAALLLQHLIDIDDSFFNGRDDFYQQESRLAKDTFLSIRDVRKAKKVLVESGAISVVKRGTPAKHHFQIHHKVIHLWFNSVTTSGLKSEPLEVQKENHKDKESKETKNRKNTNRENAEKVYQVLTKLYPKNRINSKGPILKYLETKSENELKDIVKNVKPYLDIAGAYTKNLRNYLEHECWTNEWIQEETKLKNNKNSNGNSTKNNASSFTDRNKGFFE